MCNQLGFRGKKKLGNSGVDNCAYGVFLQNSNDTSEQLKIIIQHVAVKICQPLINCVSTIRSIKSV